MTKYFIIAVSFILMSSTSGCITLIHSGHKLIEPDYPQIEESSHEIWGSAIDAILTLGTISSLKNDKGESGAILGGIAIGGAVWIVDLLIHALTNTKAEDSK